MLFEIAHTTTVVTNTFLLLQLIVSFTDNCGSLFVALYLW